MRCLCGGAVMKKLITLLLFALTTPAFGQTDRWIPISSNSNFILYIDMSTYKGGQQPSSWFKYLARKSKQKSLGLTHIVELIQFNCKDKTFAVRKRFEYNQNNLTNQESFSNPFDHPIPDTFSEAATNLACYGTS